MEDRDFEECFEDVAAINSEMRYICLELMKIASQKNIAFEQIVSEFISNTNTLKIALANADNQVEKRRRKN